MNKKQILDAFKASHPELFLLKPEIKIEEIESIYNSDTDNTEVFNPPKMRISVRHPFIFDNRLIPEEFRGIEVKNEIKGTYPKEFPSTNASLPIEEWFSPANYITFVKNNIDLIKRKLQNKNLTKEDALDALTGDFIKHKQWAEELRKKRIEEATEDIAFFDDLLEKTKIVYEKSDIKNHPENTGWSYSVTATAFKRNAPIILGFNWGVDTKWVKAGNIYGPQKDYPFRDFEGNYDDLGSLKRTISYFYDYFPEGLSGMQTNYCFLRSEKENQISNNDLNLSNELFIEIIKKYTPSIIISFSKKLLDYLSKEKLLKNIISKSLQSGNRIYSATKAQYAPSGEKPVDFVYIPHPNCPVRKEARMNAWEFCFNDR